MANEVKFIWVTGATVTFSVFTLAGVEREADTAMTETPAGSGLYLGSPTTILENDAVVVEDAGGVIGGGEYLLDPVNAKIDIIDTNVDLVLIAENKVNNIYDETVVPPEATVVID